MESLLQEVLQHRTLRDVGLLALEKPIWEWVVLCAFGLGSGLAIAWSLWHRSVSPVEDDDTPVPDSSRVSVSATPDYENEATAPVVPPNVVITRSDKPPPPPKVVRPEMPHIPIFHGIDHKPDDRESIQPKRTVYLMDVSRSLSPPQFQRCKEDLKSAIEKLPDNAPYQVILFSGASWFAHQDMIEGGNMGEGVVFRDGDQTLSWRYGSKEFTFEKGNDHLPRGSWLVADKGSKGKTIEQIDKVERSYGTTWHLPFKLAMNIDPPPEHIYFFTDGKTTRQDFSDEIIGLVNAMEADTKVDTRGLGIEEEAEQHLTRIAEETGGTFVRV